MSTCRRRTQVDQDSAGHSKCSEQRQVQGSHMRCCTACIAMQGGQACCQPQCSVSLNASRRGRKLNMSTYDLFNYA